MEEITLRRRNIRNALDQKIKLYKTEPAKGLVHGFQKDAIQNGWGHRNNKSSGKDWKMIFRIVKNEHGNFLIVEDIGCTGLIGHNYSQDEIQDMMNKKINLNEEEKLARFSTLNNSGGNTSSAGTYGIGKQMYQASSKKLKYYFDSYTIENNYVANFLDECEQTFNYAKTGVDAEKYIYANTGLKKKETHGTRIIIEDPIDEVIEAMYNGEILKYMGETWWRIVLKYNALIELYDNEKYIGKVEVPDFYKENVKTSYYQEYENIPVTSEYKVKRIGIGYSDSVDIPYELANISYFRKDMKIGNIFYDSETLIDEKYKNKIWGYIEFEDNSIWENDLKDNEDITHYGPENRNRLSFSKMKNVVLKKIDEFALSKGLVKPKEYNDINKELNDLANDLTDFLRKNAFKFPWESSKRKKSEKLLTIELEKKYPNNPFRTLEFEQEITFKVKVNNLTNQTDFDFNIFLSNGIDIKKISSFVTQIDDKYASDEITVLFADFYPKCRNLVCVEIIGKNNLELKDKSTFPVYVEIDEEIEEEDFSMQLYYELPREDSLSVYTHEEIRELSVDLINKSQYDGNFALKVMTQDVDDRNNTINIEYMNDNINLKKGTIENINIGNIIFGEKYVSRKGAIKIKFILIHKSGIDNRELGEKIVQKYFTILLNTEQIDESIKPPFNITQQPMNNNKYMRSKVEGENLIFNTLYPLWKEISKDSTSILYKMYSIETIFRTILKMQFSNGEYSTLNKTEDQISHMSINEIDELIENKVSEYIGKYFEVN